MDFDVVTCFPFGPGSLSDSVDGYQGKSQAVDLAYPAAFLAFHWEEEA